MGGTTFQNVGVGKDAGSVFAELVRRAQHDYGHAGYTGTIAEKSEYRLFEIPKGVSAKTFISWVEAYPEAGPLAQPHAALLKEANEVYDDKWGPAAAVEVPPAEHQDFVSVHNLPMVKDKKVFVFFGWASE